jgi:hypothetical protein
VLGNGIPANVSKVVIARTSGNVTTSGKLTVATSLTFASAGNLITASGDTVVLGTTATIVGEAADRSVVGRLKTSRTLAQNVAETFGGLGLTVQALGAAPGYTYVTRVTGTTLLGYKNNPSASRYYDIHATTNTGLNAKVTFNYLGTDLGAMPEGLLNAYRSTDGGTTWTEFAAIARNSVSKFIQVQGVPGFSIWTLGSYANPLPVSLTTFAGRVQNGQAILDWATASEQNNAGFEVQRSADGALFTKIGWVSAKGPGGYQFADGGFDGRAYYRLRQLDKDGQESYSKLVWLTADKATGKAQLSPIPALGKLTLAWPGAGSLPITAHLLATDGKELVTVQGTLTELSAQLTDYLATMPSGTYQLHLEYEQGQQFIRVIK